MILWTIQSEKVYNTILRTGVYHCDLGQSPFYDFKPQYDWLVEQMIKRVGERPDGVEYPVWAWYQWEGARKKPDLRRERWGNGWKGDRFACMEIDIPDKDVLLSDFDLWSIMLNDGLLSETEEEDSELENKYNAISEEEQREMKKKNRKRVFDLSYLNNKWILRGDSIQATFWELRREQIRNVRMFTSAVPKPTYPEEIKCLLQQ